VLNPEIRNTCKKVSANITKIAFYLIKKNILMKVKIHIWSMLGFFPPEIEPQTPGGLRFEKTKRCIYICIPTLRLREVFYLYTLSKT